MHFICIIRHFNEIGIILEGLGEEIWILTGRYSSCLQCILSACKKSLFLPLFFLAHRKEVDRLIRSSETIFATYLFYWTMNTLKGGKYEEI
jgi:hypothetical protein